MSLVTLGFDGITLKNIDLHIIRRIALLLAWAVALVIARSAAASPDGRLIIVDLPYFANIATQDKRHQALKDVLDDIDMFEAEAPSRAGTIILAPNGPNIRRILKAHSGSNLASMLRQHRAFKNAMIGVKIRRYQFISLADIRRSLFDSLKLLSIHQEPNNKPWHKLDIHIFAPGWRLGSTGPEKDVMRTEQATQCVVERESITQTLPPWVHVTFEFRIPEGIEEPSLSAEATFIGAVTGLYNRADNVHTRSVAGPRCAIGQGTKAKPYAHQNFIDAPSCKTDVMPISHSNLLISACGSLAPLAPAIGAGLDRRPVSVVSRPATVSLNRPRYNGTLLQQVDGSARVGGIFIPPLGQAPSGQLPTASPAEFRLSPAPGCVNGQGGYLSLASAQSAVRAQISRFYCDDAILQIGEITLP